MKKTTLRKYDILILDDLAEPSTAWSRGEILRWCRSTVPIMQVRVYEKDDPQEV